jgi:hypothetical protein
LKRLEPNRNRNSKKPTRRDIEISVFLLGTNWPGGSR